MDHMTHRDHRQTSGAHAGHKMSDIHGSHDRHAGHSVAMFRDKFWLSFAFTIPVVFVKLSVEQAYEQVEELIQNRLVGWRGDTLVFLTRQCATAFTPWGEAIAGDVDDGRLFEWIQQETARRKRT
jgi:hypothetical protein